MTCTDEHGACAGPAASHSHEAVDRGAGEYVRGTARMQGIESFRSMLERARKGTFRKVSPKHPDRYAGEFAGCRNMRDADAIDIMAAFAAGAAGKRLRHRELTAENDLPSGARSA